MIRKCKYHKFCGGCSLQGVDYKTQLKQKEEYIKSLLERFHKVNRIIGMKDPFNYRNKVQVSFGYDEKHNLICGNYVPSTHIIVEIDDCMIADNKTMDIILYIKSLLNKYKISIFNEDTLRGGVRHLQVRCTNLNEYMLIFVTGSYKVNKLDILCKDLIKKYKCIKTIVQSINIKHTSMVLGSKFNVLYGKGYIYDELCGLKFKLSPSSFYQVNKRQTEVLYKEATSLCNFSKDETVIDAYSGIGTIGLSIASKVKEVIGVEINRQAIKDAVINMKLNKINNAHFVCDDAGHFMNKLKKDNVHIDTVIMDPPRSGADLKFLDSLIYLKPSKILYISCGPTSLKSNLIYLTKHNYKVEVIQPVDMFPFTDHIETICLLKKVNYA